MTKPKFTYGDRVRRKVGGPVETVSDIGSTTYYFESGRFALLDDEDCYMLVEKASGYFRVDNDLSRAPIDRYTEHGYETRKEFCEALTHLVDWYGDRIGERRADRNGFLQLRFADMPGNFKEDKWIPLYLLHPCPMPDYLKPPPPPDPIEEELDRAFGFDWWK